MELHPASTQPAKAIDDEPSTDKMQAGAVFLSYASEDRPAVILIRDALEQAGIDVWFDRNPEALRPGDNFDSHDQNQYRPMFIVSAHHLPEHPDA